MQPVEQHTTEPAAPPTASPQEKLDIAASLIERGMPIFLLKPRSKEPLHKGWQRKVTTNIGKVSDLLIENADANIGVATGGSLLVVDIDPRHDGGANLAKLEALHGAFPKTFTVKTGSGGWHYYFKLPLGVRTRNTVGRIAVGIDTRGDGGYVVAPGSTHPDGGQYVVEDDSHELAIAPAWVLEALAAPTASRAARPRKGLFTEGRRNNDFFKSACALRKQGLDEDGILAALKSINAGLPVPLPDAEIEATVNRTCLT